MAKNKNNCEQRTEPDQSKYVDPKLGIASFETLESTRTPVHISTHK